MSDINEEEETKDYGVLVTCGKPECRAQFDLAGTGFDEPDELLGGGYYKSGFRCPVCQSENIAYWTNNKLRRRRETLKSILLKNTNHNRPIPGKTKEFLQAKKEYAKYFDKVQRRAKTKINKIAKIAKQNEELAATN